MTDQPVAVVEGPKGKAEIFEIIESGKAMVYRLSLNGGPPEEYKSLGEAYITAGEKVGTKV